MRLRFWTLGKLILLKTTRATLPDTSLFALCSCLLRYMCLAMLPVYRYLSNASTIHARHMIAKSSKGEWHMIGTWLIHDRYMTYTRYLVIESRLVYTFTLLEWYPLASRGACSQPRYVWPQPAFAHQWHHDHRYLLFGPCYTNIGNASVIYVS